MKNILVLENDDKISSEFISYTKEVPGNRNIIFRADMAGTDQIIESMKNSEILEFQPTLITFSQYNMILMCMYKLIKENSLGIKRIHIFRYRDIEDDLKDLWSDKRMYLDVVLQHVQIYQVYSDDAPRLLNI